MVTRYIDTAHIGLEKVIAQLFNEHEIHDNINKDIHLNDKITLKLNTLLQYIHFDNFYENFEDEIWAVIKAEANKAGIEDEDYIDQNAISRDLFIEEEADHRNEDLVTIYLKVLASHSIVV